MKQDHSALFLAVVLLASTLASCGETTERVSTETDAFSVAVPETEAVMTESVDSLEARLRVSDGIADTNYYGASFCILGKQAFHDYYIVEGETGDVLNDAVWARNRAVEDRFNINIDVVTMDTYYLIPAVEKSVFASDDAYQLFAGQAIISGGSVCEGLFYNWYDIPHIDFSKPWWATSVINDLTFHGKAYLAAGDFALTTTAQVYCFYYNKRLASDYDIVDLYGTVNDGKWTADMLISLCRNVYMDLNGNNEADNEDLYGFGIAAQSSPVNTFYWSFGEKLCYRQPDDSMLLEYNTEKTAAIYEKLYTLTCETEGVYVNYNSNQNDYPKDMFRSGNLLFLPQVFDYAVSSLRDFNDDYGILPYPKWDEAQSTYYTMADGAHELLAIPTSVADLDYIGSITEALNAESWKHVLPTYYDLVLKQKGTRDENSVAMIDRILDSRVFDFGYVYGLWGAAFWPQYLVSKKSADYVSYYEANHAAFDSYMQNVFDYFASDIE